MKKTKLTSTRSWRLPEDILEWLSKRINSSCRSMNGEVVYILRKAKERDKHAG